MKFIFSMLGLLCFGNTHITKGAKLTRSTSAYALPLFMPRPKNSRQKVPIQGKNNLSKVGFWEHLSDEPRNSLPRPIMTYHFLVLIGALAHYIYIH